MMYAEDFAPRDSKQDYPWEASRDKSMSMTEHLSELRGCLLKCSTALVLGIVISFFYMEKIMDKLAASAGNLYYMRPAEAFMIYMKVILLAGLVLALPIILYELYAFIRPALTRREQKFTLLALPVSYALFFGGIVFAYEFVFPRGMEFFLGFAASKINPLISLESYLDFMLMLVVPFGFVFNIPVVLVLLRYLHIVNVRTLKKYQRHVILAAFILAAFITPTPDIITQSLLALPIVILYEISIFICGFFTQDKK